MSCRYYCTSIIDIFNFFILHPVINRYEVLPSAGLFGALLLPLVLPEVPVKVVGVLHCLRRRVAHAARRALHATVQGGDEAAAASANINKTHKEIV